MGCHALMLSYLFMLMEQDFSLSKYVYLIKLTTGLCVKM